MGRRIVAAVVALAAFVALMTAVRSGSVGAIAPCPSITVASTADSGAGTLRQAISDAQSGCGSNSDVTIVIPVSLGTITLTSGQMSYSGGVGNAHNLTIQGNYNTVTGNDTDRLLYTDSSFTGRVAIDALTMKHGSAGTNGGAVYMEGTTSTLAIVASTFRDNVADGSGGAVHSWGDISITGSSFVDNVATNGQGGAVYGNGLLSLVDSAFTGNTATNDAGGAVAATSNTVVPTIVGSTFTTNTALSNGGAVYSTSTSAELDLVSSSFTDNFAQNWGGAVYVNHTVAASDSAFVGNGTGLRATPGSSGRGGAILAFGGVDQPAVLITNSTFSDNVAEDQGGAVAAWLGEVAATNSTFSGNSVTTLDGHGGAVYAFSKITATYSTFSGNSSLGDGSALWSALRTAHLFGTVLDTSDAQAMCKTSTGPVSSGYNYANDTSCGLTGTGDSQNAANDPLLTALADNGGPTETLKPQAASPLIDVIPNGSCGAGLSITTDQRGAPRPASVGEGCDVGAVEVATTIRVRSSANSGGDCTTAPTFPGCTLREALSQASVGGWAAGKDVTIEIDPGLSDIVLSSEVTYDGGTGGAHVMTINGHGNFVTGNDTFRLMTSTSTGAFSVDSLTFLHGWSTDDGGALRVAGSLAVTRSRFEYDHALSSGGAIWTDGGVVVATSTFDNNSASAYGGAMASVGSITVSDSTFTANTATTGGGALVSVNGVAATNTTFSDNSTPGTGGAIFALGGVTAAYATLTGNTAGSGGSAVTGSSIELFATVLTTPGATQPLCSSTATSDGYNYANDTSCGLTGTGDSQNVANDPLLDTLAWNGGSTATQKPQNGSPLIDRVPYGACQTAPLATGIITDQRGYARPRNGFCDTGAVEVEPSDPSAPVTTTTTRPAGGPTTSTSSTSSTSVPSTTSTTAVPTLPAPTGLTMATPDPVDRSALVTWTAPVVPAAPRSGVGGASAPTGYQLRCMPSGTPYDTGPSRYVRYVGSTTTSATVDDLVGGLDYHCLVRARYGSDIFSWKGDGNEGPLSDWSNTMHVPVTVPLAPRNVSASTPPLPTGQSTKVTFTVPQNNAGTSIRHVDATCTSSNGGVTRTRSGSGSPLTVANLTVGKRYTCSVTSTNARGTSAASNPSAVIVVPAGPPTGVVASNPVKASGKWRTSVTFTAPAGGPVVSSYRAACTPTGGGTVQTGSGPVSGIGVTNLVSGRAYRCTVTALYGSSPGPASAPSAPITVP